MAAGLLAAVAFLNCLRKHYNYHQCTSLLFHTPTFDDIELLVNIIQIINLVTNRDGRPDRLAKEVSENTRSTNHDQVHSCACVFWQRRQQKRLLLLKRCRPLDLASAENDAGI